MIFTVGFGYALVKDAFWCYNTVYTPYAVVVFIVNDNISYCQVWPPARQWCTASCRNLQLWGRSQSQSNSEKQENLLREIFVKTQIVKCVGRWVAKLGRGVDRLVRWVAKSGRWVANLRLAAKLGRWVAWLVARLLATAASSLGRIIRTSLKNTKWATKAREWATHSRPPKNIYKKSVQCNFQIFKHF